MGSGPWPSDGSSAATYPGPSVRRDESVIAPWSKTLELRLRVRRGMYGRKPLAGAEAARGRHLARRMCHYAKGRATSNANPRADPRLQGSEAGPDGPAEAGLDGAPSRTDGLKGAAI